MFVYFVITLYRQTDRQTNTHTHTEYENITSPHTRAVIICDSLYFRHSAPIDNHPLPAYSPPPYPGPPSQPPSTISEDRYVKEGILRFKEIISTTTMTPLKATV